MIFQAEDIEMYSHTNDIKFEDLIASLEDNFSTRQKILAIWMFIFCLTFIIELLFSVNQFIVFLSSFGLVAIMPLLFIAYNKFNPLPSNRNYLAVHLYHFSTEISKLCESKSKLLSKSEKKKRISNAWNALSNLRFSLKENYAPNFHFMNDDDVVFHRLFKILTETASFSTKYSLEETPDFLVREIQKWPELFYSDTLTINLKSSIDATYSLLEKDNHFVQPTKHSQTPIWTIIKNIPKPIWFVIILPTLFVFICSCYYHIKEGLSLGNVEAIVVSWAAIVGTLIAMYYFINKLKK